MDLRRLAILARGTGHEKAALGVVSLRIWRSWPAMAVVACSAVGRGCTRLRRSRINNCLPIIRRAIRPIIARRTGVPPAEPVEPILQAHQLAHVVGSAQPAQVRTFMCYGTSLMSPRVSSANTWKVFRVTVGLLCPATAAARTARAGRRPWRPGFAGPVPASSSGATRGGACAPILPWQTLPTEAGRLMPFMPALYVESVRCHQIKVCGPISICLDGQQVIACLRTKRLVVIVDGKRVGVIRVSDLIRQIFRSARVHFD